MLNLLIDWLGRRDDALDWRGGLRTMDLDTVENVCILHHNHKAGDAILLSLLIDALARARPGLRILVGASESFGEYWRNHPDVEEVIPFDLGRRASGLLRLKHGWKTALAWRDRLDVVVSFHSLVRIEHLALLRLLRPKTVIGFNKDAYRLFDYSLEEHRYGVDLAPVAAKACSVMRLFGHKVNVAQLRSHLPRDLSDDAKASETLAPLLGTGPRILLNAYGAGAEKRLTPESIRLIVHALRKAGNVGPILVSVPAHQEPVYRVALDNTGVREVTVMGPQGGLPALCALVAAVDAVVSPDTAVGHIAACLDKPQICLFARRGNIPTIWRPLNARCVVLVPTRANDVNAFDREELSRAAETLKGFLNAPDPAVESRREHCANSLSVISGFGPPP